MSKATVIVPTSIDRGMLLPYSIGSVQNQTIRDIEIFIIGDGVYDETRDVISQLITNDDRIRFFDHPKHERRGEIYRHAALQEAKGEIVCYLCDRDLMLPDHIETHYNQCKTHNFSSSMFIRVNEDSSLRLDHYFAYIGSSTDHDSKVIKKTGGLSMISHTLEFYHKLPYGWRTTPVDQPTDAYMWAQFMEHKKCKSYSHPKATILYFKRSSHPGWPSTKRLPELAHWSEHVKNKEYIEKIKYDGLIGLLNDTNLVREERDKLAKLLRKKQGDQNGQNALNTNRKRIIFHFKRGLYLLIKSFWR